MAHLPHITQYFKNSLTAYKVKHMEKETYRPNWRTTQTKKEEIKREMLSSELTEEENERNEKIDMRKIQDDINRRRR